MGPCRYGGGRKGDGVYALNLCLAWNLSHLTGREAIAYMRDPRRGDSLDLAAALLAHLEGSFWHGLGLSALETTVAELQRALSARGGEITGELKRVLRRRVEGDVGVRLYLDTNYLNGRSYWGCAHAHAAAEAAARADEEGNSVAEALDSVHAAFRDLARYEDPALADGADERATVRRYVRESTFVSIAESGLGSPAALDNAAQRGYKNERRLKDPDAVAAGSLRRRSFL